MNRHNYDPKVLSVFDTIGSYFVDVFYNDLFLKARDILRDGNANSLTDAYRNHILAYMRGITRPDLYLTVVKKLNDYYQRTSGFGTVVFEEFENKVLSQFIPPEYYRDFSSKNKDSTLHDILVKTINSFGEFVLGSEMLSRIIDNHKDAANVSLMQDNIVDLFAMQRESYYSLFAAEISKKNGNDKIDRVVVDKLKNAFAEEKKKRLTIEGELASAKNIIGGLISKLKEADTQMNELQQANFQLIGQVKSLTSPSHVQPQVHVQPQSHVQPQTQPQPQPHVQTLPLKQTGTNKSKILDELVSDSSKVVRGRGRPRNDTKTIKQEIKTPKEVTIATTDSDESDDSGEIHRKQRERITLLQKQKQRVKHVMDNVGSDDGDNDDSDNGDGGSDNDGAPTDFSLDDPGFGDD